MATIAQLNAMVDAAREYAFALIKSKVPSFEVSMADSFVTNDLLLGLAKNQAAAYEAADIKPTEK